MNLCASRRFYERTTCIGSRKVKYSDACEMQIYNIEAVNGRLSSSGYDGLDLGYGMGPWELLRNFTEDQIKLHLYICAEINYNIGTNINKV